MGLFDATKDYLIGEFIKLLFFYCLCFLAIYFLQKVEYPKVFQLKDYKKIFHNIDGCTPMPKKNSIAYSPSVIEYSSSKKYQTEIPYYIEIKNLGKEDIEKTIILKVHGPFKEIESAYYIFINDNSMPAKKKQNEIKTCLNLKSIHLDEATPNGLIHSTFLISLPKFVEYDDLLKRHFNLNNSTHSLNDYCNKLGLNYMNEGMLIFTIKNLPSMRKIRIIFSSKEKINLSPDLWQINLSIHNASWYEINDPMGCYTFRLNSDISSEYELITFSPSDTEKINIAFILTNIIMGPIGIFTFFRALFLT